ncbi:MAG: hypothetical protein DIZ77_04730 [endosymbiont of Seepiophila jonesi]|uniref:Sulfur globule protein CV1 n=1 Tax=endosymbiont of Lamellibrachia luymesi TaxID=2200907 RepID=A0A370DEY7_9GAMM|nr:MAG: hypothetical protein DIZ79_17770 [endosymbiont of Lamellibrachia luymesi]RDH93767.1 MAG: hypothetical protein DIZ77_04730 [endosymbiont of Seepiophila jonesi]
MSKQKLIIYSAMLAIGSSSLTIVPSAHAFNMGNMMNPSKWMNNNNRDRYYDDDYYYDRGRYGYGGPYGGYGGYPGYGYGAPGYQPAPPPLPQ